MGKDNALGLVVAAPRWVNFGSILVTPLPQFKLLVARALCALLLFMALNGVAAAAESRAKEVLIISTGSRFSPGFTRVDQTPRSICENSPVAD